MAAVEVLHLDNAAEHRAENEATDVRPPCDAASLLARTEQAEGAVEKLQDEPPHEEERSGDHKVRSEEKRREQHLYPRVWIQPQVRAHDRRNRTARAQGGNRGTAVREDMQQSGRQ